MFTSVEHRIGSRFHLLFFTWTLSVSSWSLPPCLRAAVGAMLFFLCMFATATKMKLVNFMACFNHCGQEVADNTLPHSLLTDSSYLATSRCHRGWNTQSVLSLANFLIKMGTWLLLVNLLSL